MRFSIDLGQASIWRHSLALGIAVRFMLFAVVTINLMVLRINRVMHRKSGGKVPLIPPLYRSGVRYREEPKEWDVEHFDTIPALYPRKWGDCDDIAPARVAELRFTGEDKRASVCVKWKRLDGKPDGQRLYHIVVRRTNISRSRIDGRQFLSDGKGGVIEDPCRVLGMGAASAEAQAGM